MKAIIGLGNIGDKYEGSPHNAGFMFIDKLADFLRWDRSYSLSEFKNDNDLHAMISNIKIGMETKAILVKPTTLMNRSGLAASAVFKRFDDLKTTDLIVVHDDLDIALGEYKIQKGVGPKKHNGINNIEQMTSRKEFWRIRVGVGGDELGGSDYLLRPMNQDSLTILEEAMADIVKSFRSTFEF